MKLSKTLRLGLSLLLLGSVLIACKGKYHGKGASTRTVHQEKHK